MEMNNVDIENNINKLNVHYMVLIMKYILLNQLKTIRLMLYIIENYI